MKDKKADMVNKKEEKETEMEEEMDQLKGDALEERKTLARQLNAAQKAARKLRLEEARDENQLKGYYTQKDWASRAGITPSTIKRTLDENSTAKVMPSTALALTLSLPDEVRGMVDLVSFYPPYAALPALRNESPLKKLVDAAGQVSRMVERNSRQIERLNRRIRALEGADME